jgi:thiamine pyrophosphokinase
MRQVVVVVGGGPLHPLAVSRVSSPVAMIAADSGLDAAIDAGLAPTRLVGDLDSLSASGRMWAYAHRIDIDEHPTDKDATDTALALQQAATSGADELLLLGGEGDRFDHTLGAVAALGDAALAEFRTVTGWFGRRVAQVVHPGRSCVIEARSGDTFSLFALHGPCAGIALTGARWPLDHAALAPGSTRGISNEALEEPWVTCGSGVLTVIVP